MHVAVERAEVSADRIPTDYPESDGTLDWDSTTLVLVELAGGGKQSLGYSYASAAAAEVIRGQLAAVVRGADALDIPRVWSCMNRAVRNVGRPGIAASAIAAVDVALWDLKARLLGLPVANLL